MTRITLSDLILEAAIDAPAGAYIAEMTALRDETADISGISTSDDVVSNLVKNTGGVGPKTIAALNAAFVMPPGAGATGHEVQFTAVKTVTDGSNVGFVKSTGTGDNGTRVYVLPPATPTSGAGGVLKIFADPFHLDTSVYRDLGLYFSADQKGDTGSQGNGMFFINSKAAVGSIHDGKNCDIAVTFQDGDQYAARFQFLPAAAFGGSDRAILIAGKLASRSGAAATNAALEVQGDIAFDDKTTTAQGGFPGRSIRWWGTSSMNHAVSFNQADLTIKISAKQALKLKPAGGVVLGDTSAEIAASATTGHLEIPTVATAPTGAFTPETGHAGIVFCRADNKLYVRVGGAWLAGAAFA